MDDGAAWFTDADPGDDSALIDGIVEGRATEPEAWPQQAVNTGFIEDVDAYYDLLHRVTMAATRTAIEAAEQADDQQLIHAVRAMDDAERLANELSERLTEWGKSHGPVDTAGIEYARQLVDSDPDDAVMARLVGMAETVVALVEERDQLRTFIERRIPSIAPNLSALAGPVLAARLISLAGSLEALAKLPSGTVQVLGAEDALFAHLRGDAPSPKHGVIYTHPYVRETREEDRGSAARAVAGKLSIAARVDHYAGDYRPGLETELDERIATIRARESEGEA